MALYKRKNSRYWWLDFEFEGRRHQVSTKLRNMRAALTFEAAYRTQLANDKVDLRPRGLVPSFRDAAADFLTYSELHNIESTHRRYLTASKAPLKFFGIKAVNTFNRETIEKFVAWRRNQKKKAPIRKVKKRPASTISKKISAATVNRELAFVRIVFNRLIENDVLVKNPLFKFKFLTENEDTFRVLERAEDSLYLTACSEPLRDVAKIILGSGLRPSEVFMLKKSDVNFDTGFISVSSGKSKAARRRIPMSKSVRAVLKSRVNTAPGLYVFGGGRDGKSEEPIVKLTNSHLVALELSKLKPPFRLYDLRHTFATRWVEDGMDIISLKDILGHSSIRMVLKYAHPGEQHRADQMSKIDKKWKAAV